MTDNNNSTAAQPLDLGRYDIDCDGLPFKDKDGPWVAYDDAVALIAQARAAKPAELTDACKAQARADFEALARRNGGAHVNLARFPEDDMFRAGRYVDSMIQDQWIGYSARASQPESATGTTGASVKTWQERMDDFAHLGMGASIAAKDAEIADLRAQLAQVQANSDDISAHLGAMVKKATELRAQLAAKGQGDDYTVDDSELARKIMVFLGRATTQSMEPGADPLRDRLAAKIALWRPAAPASAQPDRGAVQECQNCGRAPGERRDECEECPEAPASQQVVPAVCTACNGEGVVRTDELDIAPCIACQIIDDEGAPVAVAPSDAKGKADAANAGGRTQLETWIKEAIRLFGSAMKEMYWKDLDAHLKSMQDAGYRLLAQCHATSAADAKDAARLDWLMANNSDHSLKIKGLNAMGWFVYDPHTGTSGRLFATSREAIDAAMAAAPSSEKGGAK